MPIDIAHAACLYPRKYLRYLGWCVLGLEGVLVDKNGCEVSLESLLLDRGIYRYAVSESTPDGDPLARAVDLEVINFKERSGDESESVPSGYSGASDITASSQSTTCKDFVSRLVARDGWCVWTGLNGRGMHIVPYRRGNEVRPRLIYVRKFWLIRRVVFSSGSSCSSTIDHTAKTKSSHILM